MPEESTITAQSDKVTQATGTAQGSSASGGIEDSRVGDSPVGLVGIILITAYLIVLSILLLSQLVRLWPPLTEDKVMTFSLKFLGWSKEWKPTISGEVRILLIVAMTGALGSLVHALRSLYWYIGNRELKRSWLAMFVLLPLVGATLGIVFYLVVRGGFFSAQASVKDISPFMFAAMAGLVGMFSEQAVLKLKEIAETLFHPPQQGKDSAPSQAPAQKAEKG